MRIPGEFNVEITAQDVVPSSTEHDLQDEKSHELQVNLLSQSSPVFLALLANYISFISFKSVFNRKIYIRKCPSSFGGENR